MHKLATTLKYGSSLLFFLSLTLRNHRSPGSVVLVMALLGLLATWIPAQRALSVDLLVLLRAE